MIPMVVSRTRLERKIQEEHDAWREGGGGGEGEEEEEEEEEEEDYDGDADSDYES